MQNSVRRKVPKWEDIPSSTLAQNSVNLLFTEDVIIWFHEEKKSEILSYSYLNKIGTYSFGKLTIVKRENCPERKLFIWPFQRVRYNYLIGLQFQFWQIISCLIWGLSIFGCLHNSLRFGNRIAPFLGNLRGFLFAVDKSAFSTFSEIEKEIFIKTTNKNIVIHFLSMVNP